MRSILTAALILVATVGAALPEDAPMQALTTADATRGWEAVGRIDIGRSAFCTGTLIAPGLVLTAAHCLYNQQTGNRHAVEDFQFLAGWRNGRAVAYRGVRRAFAHPDYTYEGRDRMDRVAYDLALLELDQPIRLPSVHPFAVGHEPAEGDRVGVVSYALDRSEAPTLQDGCTVLGRQPGVLVLTCSVDFGSSGAPIFMMQDGTLNIVSVVSAKAEMDSNPVALGTEMTTPLAELRAAFAADTGNFRRVGPETAPDLSKTKVGGAKFIRP